MRSAHLHRRTAAWLERRPALALALAGGADLHPFSKLDRRPASRTTRLATVRQVAATTPKRADAFRVPPANRRERAAADPPTSARPPAASARRAASRRGADGRDGFAGGVRRLQKKLPPPTPPCTQRWADARSRPDKAAGSSATRNTRCGCGCLRGTPR